MTVRDIVTVLDNRAPLHTAQEWDNVGLLAGDETAEVTAVVTCLDVTEAAVEYAKQKGAQLIVSHHPVIFQPIRNLLSDSVLYRLAVNGIAVISLHTNLDAATGGINDVLAAKLGLSEVTVAPDGLCRQGTLSTERLPSDFVRLVADTLHTAVRFREGQHPIRTVAVCGGAGGDLLAEQKPMPDAVVTGELKHHEWFDFPKTVTVVEAGHYATEICAADILKDWLTVETSLCVYTFNDVSPYQTIL